MINLNLEKSITLNAQERYDIIAFAMDAADDNGFINSFVFERALYCFAAIILYPERKDELAPIVAENILTAWNKLIEDGTINDMKSDYADELNLLAADGQVWFDEYSDWAHSARGILDVVQQFSGNIVESAAQRLTSTAETTGVQEVIGIAKDWGMARNVLTPQLESKIINGESLFGE